MKKLVTTLGMIAAVLAPLASNAAGVGSVASTAKIGVSAQVPTLCSVQATDLQFSGIANQVDNEQEGFLTVICNASWKLTIDNGVNATSTGQRRLAGVDSSGVTQFLVYNIDTPEVIGVNTSGVPDLITYVADIPPQQVFGAKYTDKLTATLTFN